MNSKVYKKVPTVRVNMYKMTTVLFFCPGAQYILFITIVFLWHWLHSVFYVGKELRQQRVKKCASQHIMQYLFRRFLCPPPPPPFPHAKNVFVTSKMSVGQHNTQKHFKPSPTTHKNDPFYLYSVYILQHIVPRLKSSFLRAVSRGFCF